MGGRGRVIGRKRRKGWMEGMRKRDGFMGEKLFFRKECYFSKFFSIYWRSKVVHHGYFICLRLSPCS